MNELKDPSSSTHSLSVHLTPKLPPGRANRKTLAFCAEIHRLRAAGYSFEAIRQAFLEAGVQVSRTTLKREAARAAPSGTAAQEHSPPLSSPVNGAADALGRAPRLMPLPASYLGDARSGKEIAEAFMKRHISNPLLQGKDAQ